MGKLKTSGKEGRKEKKWQWQTIRRNRKTILKAKGASKSPEIKMLKGGNWTYKEH